MIGFAFFFRVYFHVQYCISGTPTAVGANHGIQAGSTFRTFTTTNAVKVAM